MIRAIVVDDEKLVRKGFISLIDWARFGIVIVGEAADGRTALDLLEREEADLLFTDITMPGMSGFDLIKQVRQRFPRIRSVVLTCHHEFDFVQEALRLGAIDYIVKTLLELDNADDSIGRIIERFEWDEGSRATLLANGSQERMKADSAMLFCPRSAEEDGGELFKLGICRRNPLQELEGMWMAQLVHSPTQEELNRGLGSDLLKRWQVAVVTGIMDQSTEEIKRVLVAKLRHLLFYNGSLDKPSRFSYSDLVQMDSESQARIQANVQPRDLIESGLGLKWTLYYPEWEAFVQGISEHRPDPKRVIAFAKSLCRDWGELLMSRTESEALRMDFGRYRNWSDWKGWLRRFADQVQRRMIELSLSKEVMIGLIRAIQYMRLHAGEKINQNDVSVHIHMSRSYFSQCFARFAGESFGVMLRNLRIDRAKALLLETAVPIYEVASRAGFEDDKYFSKLFRERVGVLPTEYRAAGWKMV